MPFFKSKEVQKGQYITFKYKSPLTVDLKRAPSKVEEADSGKKRRKATLSKTMPKVNLTYGMHNKIILRLILINN